MWTRLKLALLLLGAAVAADALVEDPIEIEIAISPSQLLGKCVSEMRWEWGDEANAREMWLQETLPRARSSSAAFQ